MLKSCAIAMCFLLLCSTGVTRAADAGRDAPDANHCSRLPAGSAATLQSIMAFDAERGFYGVDYTVDYGLEDLMRQGADSQKALHAFISERLLSGLPFYHEPLRLACSTFSAATPDGDFIQGRNMDLAGARSFLVRTRPERGYESLSMVSGLPLGYVDSLPDSLIGRLLLLAAPYFPTDGINEKGLSVAILLLQDKPVNQDRGKIPVTTMLAARLLLDRAATVEEAVALLEGHDMHSMYQANYHYHIADAQGKSVVVEYVDNKMQVVRPEGYGQVATNFFLSPQKKDLLDDGKDRLAILQAELDRNKGKVTPQTAWHMLKSVEAVDDFDDLTGINFTTAYSIIYNNSRRTMDVCVGANFATVFSYKVGEGF